MNIKLYTSHKQPILTMRFNISLLVGVLSLLSYTVAAPVAFPVKTVCSPCSICRQYNYNNESEKLMVRSIQAKHQEQAHQLVKRGGAFLGLLFFVAGSLHGAVSERVSMRASCIAEKEKDNEDGDDYERGAMERVVMVNQEKADGEEESGSGDGTHAIVKRQNPLDPRLQLLGALVAHAGYRAGTKVAHLGPECVDILDGTWA